MQISLNLQTSCPNLTIRVLEAKLCVTFLLFLFWKESWSFKVEGSMLFWWTLIKMRWNQKSKATHMVLERWILNFSSYKNPKLKVKPWWVQACEKQCIFCNIFFSEGNLCSFSIYSVLNKLSEYIHFYISKNIISYTFVACF